MKTLFSLGKIFPSDFLRPDEQPRCEPIELKLMMDDNGLVFLNETAPKEVMWGRYWYRSGINSSMTNALKEIVDSILPLMKFEENSIWLDIASNDGTLLSFVPDSFIKIGIDPVEDSFKEQAERYADLIIQDYFSAAIFKQSKFGKQKVKVLTSIAMFYDLEDPVTFLKEVYEILEDDGLWVLQLSYTPLMIHQTAFDNIVHEHKYYYSLYNLAALLAHNKFVLKDCQLNDVNGGSFRLYVMKDDSDSRKFATQPYRDVCMFRRLSLLKFEQHNNTDDWAYFYKNIKKLKEEVVSFIKIEVANGKRVWAYGASTKGNTLLQYFGLDNTLIDGIADRNIDKWGLRTVGSDITIYPECDMRAARPDYLLILPWHFLSEFLEREKEIRKSGTKFIVPCPQFLII